LLFNTDSAKKLRETEYAVQCVEKWEEWVLEIFTNILSILVQYLEEENKLFHHRFMRVLLKYSNSLKIVLF
jgi:hypothetical protein